MWIITNKKDISLFKSNRSENFGFYTDEIFFQDDSGTLTVYCEGYIIPRTGISISLSGAELVKYLYLIHGSEFINEVKGNFIIIIADGDKFFVFSDRFATKKFFYWQRNDDFIISDKLEEITKIVTVEPSKESMAVYALTYHFIGGITIFKDIFYNKQAETIELKNKKLQLSRYWDSKDLTELSNINITYNSIAENITNTIQSYFTFYPSKRTSLSLTAGVDSRLLFSILKTFSINLHTYTYGNPESNDCLTAKNIAEKFNVPHTIHNINYTKESFKKSVYDTVKYGQSLCSLHRSHRFKAIEMEAQYGDSMFLGTMGGEFVKGPDHDDYIISDFIFEFSQSPNQSVIRKYLIMKGINPAEIDIDYLTEFFREQNWCKYPDLVEFYGLTEIALGLHHAQNDILYRRYFKKVFTPYIDIDYLELLFSSGFHFLINNNHKSRYSKSLGNHKFGSKMQCILLPRLGSIPYNSGVSANEYNINPLYAGIRAKLRKWNWSYKPNFPLGTWMQEFAYEQLQIIGTQSNDLTEVFNIKELEQSLTSQNVGSQESFWLKYTTPIQMSYIIEIFRKNDSRVIEESKY